MSLDNYNLFKNSKIFIVPNSNMPADPEIKIEDIIQYFNSIDFEKRIILEKEGNKHIFNSADNLFDLKSINFDMVQKKETAGEGIESIIKNYSRDNRIIIKNEYLAHNKNLLIPAYYGDIVYYGDQNNNIFSPVTLDSFLKASRIRDPDELYIDIELKNRTLKKPLRKKSHILIPTNLAPKGDEYTTLKTHYKKENQRWTPKRVLSNILLASTIFYFATMASINIGRGYAALNGDGIAKKKLLKSIDLFGILGTEKIERDKYNQKCNELKNEKEKNKILERENKNYISTLKRLTKEKDEYKSKYKQFEPGKRNLELAIHDLNKEKKQYKNRINKITNEKELAQKQYDKYKSKYAQSEEKNRNLEKTVDDLNREKEQDKTKIDNLTNQRDEARTEAADYKGKYNDKKAESERLSKEKSNLEGELDDAKNKYNSEVPVLKNKLKETNNELNNLKKDIKDTKTGKLIKDYHKLEETSKQNEEKNKKEINELKEQKLLLENLVQRASNAEETDKRLRSDPFYSNKNLILYSVGGKIFTTDGSQNKFVAKGHNPQWLADGNHIIYRRKEDGSVNTISIDGKDKFRIVKKAINFSLSTSKEKVFAFYQFWGPLNGKIIDLKKAKILKYKVEEKGYRPHIWYRYKICNFFDQDNIKFLYYRTKIRCDYTKHYLIADKKYISDAVNSSSHGTSYYDNNIVIGDFRFDENETNLYAIDIKKGTKELLVKDAKMHSISHDKTKLAYEKNDTLYIANISGNSIDNLKVVTDKKIEWTNYSNISWSKSDDYIVGVAHFDNDAKYKDIYIYDLKKDDWKRATNSIAWESNPQFRPK